MMNARRAKKVLGAVVAAVTLTMVTSVAPASAAQPTQSQSHGGHSMLRGDTGWDIP